MSIPDELKKLADLKAAGALTDAEFQQAKQRVLSGTEPQQLVKSAPPPMPPQAKASPPAKPTPLPPSAQSVAPPRLPEQAKAVSPRPPSSPAKATPPKKRHLLRNTLITLGVIVLLLMGVGAFKQARREIGANTPRDPELENSLRIMSTAASSYDFATFSQYVDMDAVRESMKAMFGRSMREAQSQGKVEAIPAILTTLLLNNLADNTLTQDNLPKMMQFFAAMSPFIASQYSADPTEKKCAYYLGSDFYVVGIEGTNADQNIYGYFKKYTDGRWRFAGITNKKP